MSEICDTDGAKNVDYCNTKEAFSVLLNPGSGKEVVRHKVAEIRNCWERLETIERVQLVKLLVLRCTENNIDSQEFVNKILGRGKISIEPHLKDCYQDGNPRVLKLRLNGDWFVEAKILERKSELLGDKCEYQIGLCSYKDTLKNFDLFPSYVEAPGGAQDAHVNIMSVLPSLRRKGVIERTMKERFPEGRAIKSFDFSDEDAGS